MYLCARYFITSDSVYKDVTMPFFSHIGLLSAPLENHNSLIPVYEIDCAYKGNPLQYLKKIPIML